MICSYRQSKKVKVCTGDKDTLIQIVSRSISSPAIGSMNPTTTFTTVLSPWAMVETIDLSGSNARLFDSVNIEDRPTHKLFIDYDSTIWPLDSDNNFVVLDGKRLRIVGAKDINEMKTTIEILCTNRGVNTKEATKA